MTDLEKAQLTELVERAWRCAPEGFEDFNIETFKDVSLMRLPKGFTMVRSRELVKIIREWNCLKEKQVIQEVETPDLEEEIKKGFGLVKHGSYKIGHFVVAHELVEARLIIVTLVIGFILGVFVTALANWIF